MFQCKGLPKANRCSHRFAVRSCCLRRRYMRNPPTNNDDNSMTISYREPYVTNSNKRSSQILSTITTLTSFLEAINGTYAAKQASGTNFDLRTLEITSNEGNVFVVQAQR